MISSDVEINGPLRTVRIIYTAMMLALVIYAVILYAFLPGQDIYVFTSEDPELVMIEVVLAVVSVFLVIIGYFGIKLIRRFTNSGYGYTAIYIVRVSFFESIGIFGLLLGIVGAGWQISLPFLFVSAATLIVTFPTEERWKKTLEKIGPID